MDAGELLDHEVAVAVQDQMLFLSPFVDPSQMYCPSLEQLPSLFDRCMPVRMRSRLGRRSVVSSLSSC